MIGQTQARSEYNRCCLFGENSCNLIPPVIQIQVSDTFSGLCKMRGLGKSYVLCDKLLLDYHISISCGHASFIAIDHILSI